MPEKWLCVFILVFLFFSCNSNHGNDFVASSIVEGTAVNVAAQTGGLILDLPVETGQEISRGQIIAVIDTEKLVYQLDQIEATLEELKVQEKMNQNTLEKARVDFQILKKKYQRYQELYRKKSVSEQVVDDLKQAYEAARTQLQNARQTMQMLESKRKGLEAQRKLIRKQIRDATVTAPISGVVTTKYFEAGETVPPGAAVVEIIDLSHMWTKIYVSEPLLARIKIGQPATIHVDGSDQTLTGRVTWISPKAEFTPKTILTTENRTSLVYAVKIEMDNPEGILKHGMPVQVELHWDNRT